MAEEQKENKVNKKEFEQELDKELNQEVQKGDVSVDVTGIVGRLETLPDQIGKIVQALEGIRASIEGIEKEITGLKAAQEGIQTSLGATKKSLEKVQEVQKEVETVKKSLEQPVQRKSIQGAEPIEKAGDGLSPYELKQRLIKSLSGERDPQRNARLGHMIALIEAGGMPAQEELKEFGIV